MKLCIVFRGKKYLINRKGEIQRTDLQHEVSGDWLFLGVSFHHWRNGIDIDLKKALDNPQLLIKGLVWDLDHGTTRQWLGLYNGKLPRITNAYLTD